jgi:pyruvate, orthophosphate dikinase
MVFGNAGGASGAGVGFTRNPATGARELYFDFQFDGQGEDVVAGRRNLTDHDRLRLALPSVWTRLNEICRVLETLFGDAQDFEFTVQSGTLFLLQTRRAKQTDWAALAIAVDIVAEGVLTPKVALAQIAGIDLGSVVRTSFAPPAPPTLATALVASLGVASGAIALDPAAAVLRLVAAGRPAILVHRDTVTSDIVGMAQADGILTGSGGRTSHAAVVARQLGKVCLVACPRLEIDLEGRQCRIGDTLLDEGDMLVLDGNTGPCMRESLRWCRSGRKPPSQPSGRPPPRLLSPARGVAHMRLSDSPINYRLGSRYSVITAFLYATQEPFSFPAARRLNILSLCA